VAEAVKKAFNVQARLAADLPGGCDVIVDGNTIFSGAKAHRYPKEGEVTGEIRNSTDPGSRAPAGRGNEARLGLCEKGPP
jgi:hypothetical protein